MKKIGRHKPLSLVNAMDVSRELANDPLIASLVDDHIRRPRIDRWLVRGPLVEPRVVYIEDDDYFTRNTVTAVARGVWDAVYIGRRKHRKRR